MTTQELFWQTMAEHLNKMNFSYLIRREPSTMNPIKLIVNIYHEAEHTPYAIRLVSSGALIAGLPTIQAVDTWLKTNGGGFASDPKETEAGYCREAQIAAWAYHAISQKAA